MHGVPRSLDLTALVGAILQRIDLGIHIVHFHFDCDQITTISVEGDWEIRDGEGELVDQWIEPQERLSFKVHVLLGCEVRATEVHAPESFLVRFDSGHTLQVFDHSKNFESFSIEPMGIYV